jgi:hypothetical protein
VSAEKRFISKMTTNEASSTKEIPSTHVSTIYVQICTKFVIGAMVLLFGGSLN